jgi:hypothetical protein
MGIPIHGRKKQMFKTNSLPKTSVFVVLWGYFAELEAERSM